jgi:hypothetical protein
MGFKIRLEHRRLSTVASVVALHITCGLVLQPATDLISPDVSILIGLKSDYAKPLAKNGFAAAEHVE